MACFSAMQDIDAGFYDSYGFQPDRSGVLTCINIDTSLGRIISQQSWRITEREQSRGGYLSFDQADNFRTRIFNDTYIVRQTLRNSIKYGEVVRCEELRDRAVEIIREIVALLY